MRLINSEGTKSLLKLPIRMGIDENIRQHCFERGKHLTHTTAITELDYGCAQLRQQANGDIIIVDNTILFGTILPSISLTREE